jgi:hypothetical protein
MVGPARREWKILRETDGEQFVPLKKAGSFQGEFANEKNEIDAQRSI